MKFLIQYGIIKELSKLLKKRIKEVAAVEFFQATYKLISISFKERTYILDEPEKIVITFNSPKEKIK